MWKTSSHELSKPLLFATVSLRTEMHPWSFNCIPKDIHLSRKGVKMYCMNKQQEALTFCPKAVSLWGKVPHLAKSWVWQKNRQLLTNKPDERAAISEERVLFLEKLTPFSTWYLSFWWESGDSLRYSPIPAASDCFLITLLSGMQIGSTAVHDSTKFRHLSYGKQGWEILCVLTIQQCRGGCALD